MLPCRVELAGDCNGVATGTNDVDAVEGEDADYCTGLEALFEDWIVDNNETPMIVPQTGTEFVVEFQLPPSPKPTAAAAAAAVATASPRPAAITGAANAATHPPSAGQVTLSFRQDPAMRARELPDDGSCPLRATLSETEQVSATGAVSWNGGVSLGHFCAVSAASAAIAAGFCVHGLSAVELGAGTGVCAAMAAAAGARVTATDRAELLPVLRTNAALNAAAVRRGGGELHAREYSWGETSPDGFPGGRTFDLILAADCVYDMEGIAPLLCALRDLSHTNPAAAEPTGTAGAGEHAEHERDERERWSATRAFIAYDTAIGHYDVYKAFHRSAREHFRVVRIPNEVLDDRYTSKYIQLYELVLRL